MLVYTSYLIITIMSVYMNIFLNHQDCESIHDTQSIERTYICIQYAIYIHIYYVWLYTIIGHYKD